MSDDLASTRTLPAEPPPALGPAPDVTGLRYRSDGASAWIVFSRGDRLGRIERRRVVVNADTGRKAGRWFYTPGALGWRGKPAPTAAFTGTEVGPHPGHSRADAARLLVDHLHRHGCPAVARLYPRES